MVYIEFGEPVTFLNLLTVLDNLDTFFLSLRVQSTVFEKLMTNLDYSIYVCLNKWVYV